MILLKNISFAYSTKLPLVLKDISLTISAGEDVCVMGHNGSGKSTLVRLIAGLQKPTDGSISLGDDMKQGSRMTIGFLFQNPDNQMVAMTGAKEVAFALENKATPVEEMEQCVDETLTAMDISLLAKRLTNELSGGEKQRVALASVIVDRPNLLILDEPHSFLDAEGRRRLDQLLLTLRDEYPDMVIIRVTQYPKVAKEYPRLILLSGGSVIADSDSATVLKENDFFEPTQIRSVQHFDSIPSPHEQHSRKIELDNVSFGFESDNPILEKINLTLNAGETVALVGPTGSGKSSIGMLLSGLIEPSSGRVKFGDSDNNSQSHPQPGLVSAVFQMPERQFFLSTAAEEIAFGPKNIGRPLNQSQVEAFFQLVGLEADIYADRDPLSLSVGEKRRLAFACVLSMRPSFVIFDEPTTALDSQGLAMFIRLSRQLKQSGVGQLLISHERSLVEMLADRLYCLRGDRSLSEHDVKQGIIDPSLANLLVS